MKKPKIPNFIVILILTLVTIVVWVGFEAYNNLTNSEEIELSEEVIEPLTPTLDKEALDNVNQRLFFEESEIGEPAITITEATEESELIETTQEESTESAQI